MRKINLLSVVMPCHNEQEVLPTTHEQLTGILTRLASTGKIRDYEIVAVDNGDPTDLTAFAATKRRAFNGLALVVLRTRKGRAGAIVLRAKSSGLPSATVKIRSVKP